MDAHLGRPKVPSLARAAYDLLLGQEIPFLLPEVAAEGAEPAPLDTDIREVDVAVDDVRDGVADRLPAKLVGRGHEDSQFAA